MTDPALVRNLVADLRGQLMDLTNGLTPYGDLPAPSRRLGPRFDNATGVVWEIDCPSPLGVIVVDGEHGVFLEGGEFSYGSHWHALSAEYARALGRALLAAAAASDKQTIGGPDA